MMWFTPEKIMTCIMNLSVRCVTGYHKKECEECMQFVKYSR